MSIISLFRRLTVPGLALLLAFVPSLRAFSVAGTTYTTNGSQADVAAAISGAPAGAVIQIPAGTFTWGTGGAQLFVNTAVILTGEGAGSTIINLDPTGPTGTSATIAISAAATVKGFTLNGAPGVVAFSTSSASGWRITGITYNAGTDAAYFCFIDQGYGLIDSCVITGGGGTNELIFARGPTNSWQTPDSLGGANNVFVENCTFNGAGYVCDANANARLVVRYCTITGSMKVDGHGFASNTPRGVRHMEVYGNTWTTSTQAQAAVEIRGGTGFVFNNQATNQAPALFWFLLDDYGPLALWPNFGNIYQTPANYPITDQIGVGMDPKTAASQPMYLWNNLAAPALNAGSATQDWTLTWKQIPSAAITTYQQETGNGAATFILQNLIQADRDYYKQTAGTVFNGSTGVGVGTTAQMRAITPSKTGVGFWVTDQGSWNISAPGSSGQLYTWNGTAWTLLYTPYTYPNPMRAPIPPSNLVLGAGFTLQWNDNSTDEVGFVIQRSGNGGPFVPIATVGANVTAFQDATANTVTTYAYAVYAYSAIGNSPTTNVATNAPTFTVQPPAWVTQPVFGTATFSAAASGIPAPSYQWQKNGTGLSDGGNVSGSGTATLTLNPLSASDAATYTVVASNGFAPNALSNGSGLTVSPAAQTITFGALGSVSFLQAPFALGATSSSGLTIAYASSNSAVAIVSGSTLTVVGTGSTVITAAQPGNATYLPASSVQQTLLVAAGSQTITFTPLSAVTYGTGSFALTASASSGLPVGFSSSSLGVATVSGSTLTIVGAGTVNITASQSGNSSYAAAPKVVQPLTINKATQTITFPPLPALLAGSSPYTLVATASSGLPVSFSSGNFNIAATSGTTLTIGSSGGTTVVTATQLGNGNYSAAPSVQQTLQVNSLPAFTTQPASRTVTAGAGASFTIVANAIPPPAYQWQVSSDAGATWTNLTDGGVYAGSATTVLSIVGATALLNGERYRVLATNAEGTTSSNAATLTVNFAPMIVSQPTSRTAVAGSTAIFTVAASGNPLPTYQWQAAPTGGSNFVSLTDNAIYSGSATATLVVTDSPSGLNGQVYRCVINNSLAAITSTPATLTVDTAPTLTAQPASQTVLTGSNLTFAAPAIGNPLPTYQWQISTARGGSTFVNLSDTAVFSGSSTAVLSIAGSPLSLDGFVYRCVVTNAVATVTSAPATLIVDYAPAITLSPASQSVSAGTGVTFIAAATGEPTPNWQWQILPAGGSTWINLTEAAPYSGTITGSLAIAGAAFGLSGNRYRAVAANTAGSVTSAAATLTVVLISPVFTTQPTASQTVAAGARVAFVGAASGDPVATLQWQTSANGGATWANLSNGAAYAGTTTGVLIITSAALTFSGDEYRCVATNAAGSAISRAGLLTVVDPSGGGSFSLLGQTITFAAPSGVRVGTTVLLSASVSSGLPVTFSLVSGNASLNGFALTVFDSNPVVIQADQIGNSSYAPAPSTSQTVVGLATQQTYFGSLSPAGSSGALAATGSFAAYVSAAGTSGNLIAYLPSQQFGVVFNFTIAQGTFSGQSAAVTSRSPSQPLTVSGSLIQGTMTGTIPELGLALAAADDPVGGPSAAQAGYYPAANLYAVVGTQNQILVLVLTPGSVSAGTGTVGTAGSYAVQTSSGAEVTGVINAPFGTITGVILPASGDSILVAGLAGAAAPAISPSAQTVNTGASATFTTPASSGSTYQWQFDGSNVPGATGSSYTIAQMAGYQAGLYSVVVSSGGVSVPSNAASVAVIEGARLVNLSARGYAGLAAGQGLYTGFVVTGAGAKTLLLRGIGPGLTGLGITGALPNAVLTLYDSASNPVASQSGWGNAVTFGTSAAATVQPATAAQMAALGAFPLVAGDGDSALLAQLPAGQFTTQVAGSAGGIALAEAYDNDALSSSAQLANLSVRAPTGAGPLTLAAGFVISGTTSQTVLVRGIGPALGQFQVTGLLAEPRLTLYDQSGAVIATDIGWSQPIIAGPSTTAATVQSATADLMSRVYAFGLPVGSPDSALVATLPPGLYTVEVDGADGGTGVALVEIYNLP